MVLPLHIMKEKGVCVSRVDVEAGGWERVDIPVRVDRVDIDVQIVVGLEDVVLCWWWVPDALLLCWCGLLEEVWDLVLVLLGLMGGKKLPPVMWDGLLKLLCCLLSGSTGDPVDRAGGREAGSKDWRKVV